MGPLSPLTMVYLVNALSLDSLITSRFSWFNFTKVSVTNAFEHWQLQNTAQFTDERKETWLRDFSPATKKSTSAVKHIAQCIDKGVQSTHVHQRRQQRSRCQCAAVGHWQLQSTVHPSQTKCTHILHWSYLIHTLTIHPYIDREHNF